MNTINDCYTLNNGVKIPCVGFGTWKAAEGNTSDIITKALDVGYRYFDTASFYGTEKYIGQALKTSSVKREDIFLASKVWKDEMGYKGVKKAFAQTLENLGTDYLDLYLIHWPVPEVGMAKEEWQKIDIDTWRGMEELYRSGKVRAIGLSNFLPHHLINLEEHWEVAPAVNQLELHPGYLQSEAVRYCIERGILLQAWSPIARGRILNETALTEIAAQYQVTTAKLCLRFLLQKEMVLIPKASTEERMKENMNIFDFKITKEDMYRIETLPQMGWSGEHPDYERIKR